LGSRDVEEKLRTTLDYTVQYVCLTKVIIAKKNEPWEDWSVQNNGKLPQTQLKQFPSQERALQSCHAWSSRKGNNDNEGRKVASVGFQPYVLQASVLG